MIGLKVTALDSFIKKKEKIEEMFGGKSLKEGFQEIGEVAKEYAEILCPVDTGELKSSIYMIVNEDGFELGADAKHAVFNEYGCYNLKIGSIHAPLPAKYAGFRPFLRPAIYRARIEFEEIFGKKISEIVMHG